MPTLVKFYGKATKICKCSNFTHIVFDRNDSVCMNSCIKIKLSWNNLLFKLTQALSQCSVPRPLRTGDRLKEDFEADKWRHVDHFFCF